MVLGGRREGVGWVAFSRRRLLSVFEFRYEFHSSLKICDPKWVWPTWTVYNDLSFSYLCVDIFSSNTCILIPILICMSISPSQLYAPRHFRHELVLELSFHLFRDSDKFISCLNGDQWIICQQISSCGNQTDETWASQALHYIHIYMVVRYIHSLSNFVSECLKSE